MKVVTSDILDHPSLTYIVLAVWPQPNFLLSLRLLVSPEQTTRGQSGLLGALGEGKATCLGCHIQ